MKMTKTIEKMIKVSEKDDQCQKFFKAAMKYLTDDGTLSQLALRNMTSK